MTEKIGKEEWKLLSIVELNNENKERIVASKKRNTIFVRKEGTTPEGKDYLKGRTFNTKRATIDEIKEYLARLAGVTVEELDTVEF